MSLFSSYYAWRPVSSGIRTRIWQGPLVNIAPVQWVVFGHSAAAAPISFFVTVYTASPPWYLTASGTGTVWPLANVPGGGRSTGAPAWDTGFPLWLLASPWVEVFVTTNRSCLAQLQVFG
jgi:hypothetical protein